MKKDQSQTNGKGTVWSGLMKALRLPVNRQELAAMMVREYLDDTLFPASKQDLVQSAAAHEAPENLLMGLRQLADRDYQTLEDVAANLDPSYIR